MKTTLLTFFALSSLSIASAVNGAEYRGRIIEASACSQIKDATYFSSAKQRDLKCKRIRLPGNDICDATLRDPSRPSKIALDIPGLSDHQGARSGTMTFTKGGVIVYQSHERTGGFTKKAGLFSRQKIADQLEFKLTARSGNFHLSKIALYLDHTVNGSRMYWSEYVCDF